MGGVVWSACTPPPAIKTAEDFELDTVQKMSLDSFTWELMLLKLPQAASCIPCFKTDTQVYLVINKTLYSFTPLQVKPIKTLAQDIVSTVSY
jgi:hypothetical protein